MRIVLITLCISLNSILNAQTIISGKVIDAKGVGIPTANVFLQDTYDGTSTNADGTFEFVSSETGSKMLLVKFIGFKEIQQQVTLDGKPLFLSIELKESINELQTVIISAGSFTASDELRKTVFKAVDIATTAGATADIAGALNTLPGTQKVGESGKLFVRGGDGNEARTFIDGLVVLDAYSPSAPNTPSRGRFLPFMFKGTSFSTGGYSAEYGQALSSALTLDSRDKSEMNRTDIGILSLGGDLTHTQAWETGSIAGKLQYTNIRPYFGLINQEVDWSKPPVSLEGSTAFRQKISGDGMIKFFGNFSHSNFSLYHHDIDNYTNKQLYDLTNNYRYLNGFYKDLLNENWMVRGGVSYTYLQNNVELEKDKVNEAEQGVHAKTVLEGSISENLEIKTGIEIIHRSYRQEFYSSAPVFFNELIAAGFAEADVYATNKFVTRLGARIEYNDLIKSSTVDPRISLAYKTGDIGQVSLAYGQFRQSPKNEWLRINQSLKSEEAEHFILNYQHVANNKTFRIETYYKRYVDLIKFVNGNATELSNNGSGYAKGIEVFWRDNESLRNVDYWVSYSLLDTKRNYLHFPHAATPNFASKHNLSVVYKHFVRQIKSQLGFTYSLASGRPFYNPNSNNFNGDRTPRYEDLSFNWSYLPRPYIIVYFSCTNLLGRDNIFSYEYSNQLNEEGFYNGRAIRQPANRFLFIGIFITLSKNKSVNQLPTL
jgi:hypothetical protein